MFTNKCFTFEQHLLLCCTQSIRRNDLEKNVLFHHANYEYDLLYMRTKAFTRKT